jgi:hypothetical protein
MTPLPGISEAFARAAGLEERSEPEPHLFIPYHDRTGVRTGHSRWRLYRLRPDGQKYHQEPGSAYAAYFCQVPLCPCSALFLVEGEKKALALTEAGYPAVGLPGLSCYIADANGHPQILPELHEAIRFAAPQEICFIGDADTVTNLQYARSGHFLATMFAGITVHLLQLSLDGPKGVDDLRGQLNGQFPDRLTELRKSAVRTDPQY